MIHPGRYRDMPSSMLRVMLRATSRWPFCDMFRTQRLAIDFELTARAIEEALAEGAWPVTDVEGVQ